MASNSASPPAQRPPALLIFPATHQFHLQPFLPSSEPDDSRSPRATNSKLELADGTPIPHLTLTYACSLDSQISLARGVQTVLSGPESKAMTHYLRSQHDAILVGVGTAETDDPGLNCRFSADGETVVGLESQPTPVVLDPSGRWSCKKDCKLLQLAREGKGKPPLWLVGSSAAGQISDSRIGEVIATGGDFIMSDIRWSDGGVNWYRVLLNLARKDFRSVMVEGGARVIEDLLRQRNHEFVSSVIVTMAPVWLGSGGVTVCPPRWSVDNEAGRLEGVKWLPMGEDVVMAGKFSDRVTD